MEQELLEQFEKMKPIICNVRKRFHIKLWSQDDYYQEAMIILYKMLEKGYNEKKLPLYFKVKFTQHMTNVLRRENAKKRQYNIVNYFELKDVEYCVADRNYQIDSTLLYEDTKSAFLMTLNAREKQLILDLLEGKSINRMTKHRLKQKLIQFLKDNGDV